MSTRQRRLAEIPDEEIVDALEAIFENGREYFHARDLCHSLELSPQAIGHLLSNRDLPVEPWNPDGQGITWRYVGHRDGSPDAEPQSESPGGGVP